MYTQLSLWVPHETMVRPHMPSARAGRNPSRGGRRRRNRRRMPSCTSRRTWAKRREARAAVGAVRILGAGGPGPPGRRRWKGSRSRCRDAPVGGAPRRERKRSHSTPPSRDDGGVERRRCRARTAACQPPGVIQE